MDGSLLGSQDQEEEPQEQQRQGVAVELIREDDDDGEERRHQDEAEETSSGNHYPKGSDRGYDTSDKDDEDARPAKRQKLPPAPTDNALTPPEKPTPVDNNHHHTPQTSRNPSITVESAPFVEYQEWPFQGFLKRTKIGSETMYNLEFKLPYISGCLNVPINPKALDTCSSMEAPARAAIPHEAATHSKMYPAALPAQTKRAPWTPEEDATLLRMRNEGCPWEDIHTALPHRSKGTIQVHYSVKLKR